MNKTSDIQNLRACINGYKIAQVLMSAEEIGIFAAIALGYRTVTGIATHTAINAERVTIILNALECIGILRRTGETYEFTQYGELLDPRCERAQNGYLRYAASVKGLWSSLGQVLRDPECTSQNFASITGGDDELTTRFLAAMDANARPQARWLAEHFDFTDHAVLDMGAGAGTYSIAVANQYPSAQVVACDLPEISNALSLQIEKAKLSKRVHTQTGDYHLTLPQGPFDDVFLFAVIHQESPEACLDLLRKVKQVVRPSGKLFMTSFFVDDSRSRPEFAVLFAVEMLVMVPGGRVYSFTEIECLLKDAGFTSIEKHDEIPGPATLYIAS